MLLIAKILVVSRSLLQTISQHEFSPPFLEDLRIQLASLSRTLLKRIDKCLATNNAADDNIIQCLTAFCLATRSSADDAIHHFQQVRLDVIVNQLNLSRDNVPNALRLFIRSLQTSKVLRSRQFFDVLSKLKARPILSDPDIHDLDGLDIEVLGRWAAPDVTNFTPWIKLSELSRTEGVEAIKEWFLQAFERFAEGCQKALASSDDFSELLSLRAESLELWLSSWGSTITHRSVDVLERLRNIFNDQLKRVLTVEVQTGDEIATQILLTISFWETTEHVPVGSIWDPDLITADFSNGAAAFKQSVADRLLGRNEAVSKVLKKYEDWLRSVEELKDSIASIRSLKWTDILVGAEVEDEDVDVTPRLNADDPDSLFQSLHTAVNRVYDTLQISFSDALNTLGKSHQGEKATFLLRLIKLVRRDIPAGFVADGFVFSSNVVPELQRLLAAEIVAQTGSLSLVPPSKAQSEVTKPKTVPGRSLWEGDPAVPVQPLPGTFKFLRGLTTTMDGYGSDLWDPSTVRVLKTELQRQLELTLNSTLDLFGTGDFISKIDVAPAEDGGTPESSKEADAADAKSGKSDTASETDPLHDWKVQLLFDTVYLAHMLGDLTQLAGVVDRVQKSVDPTAEARKAIQKAARDYWKRTELLFGLLAQ